MVEQSSVPSSTGTAPLNDASEQTQNSTAGYAFVRPSFSYLNAIYMPPGSSQLSSASPMMQSESLGSSSASLPPMSSGLSVSTAPSFSSNVLHSRAGSAVLSCYQLACQYGSFNTLVELKTELHNANQPQKCLIMAIEQGLSAGGKSASSPAQSMLPPGSSLPSHSPSFAPGAAVQVMAPSGAPVVAEGISAHAVNYSLNGNVPPKQTDQPHRINVRLDGTQDMAPSTSSPAVQSASHPALPSSSPSATYFASNNFNNMATWIPPPPAFQVPRLMLNTPVTPAPPGIASSLPSPSNSVVQTSSLESAAPPRTFMPAAPVLSNPSTQHNVISMYPSPSPQAAPPGPWLQPQQISAFARPPFSPFAAVVPGPFPTPTRGMPPVSVALPDIQPPGVPPAVSAVGASTSAVGQPAIGFGLAELPPGVENSKYVGNAETKDEAPIKEQLDAWTAHRTETGNVYYYNALTGESTYEKPSGFKGESDKATVRPTPISWEKLTGTDWTLVSTNDGKRYYYNTTTQEMLKERGVAPFSKWEKELPKIVFDPRFKGFSTKCVCNCFVMIDLLQAIPNHSARRALFEHHVRTRAEEERKEKRAAQKAALEGFKQLLEEAKERRWGEDPRFQALERKEREALLNERVLPLKRTAQEKAQAERAAAISNFKSMLQDKGNITSSSAGQSTLRLTMSDSLPLYE
ncbi:Pre-processing protein 40C [Sesamum angolense]|uniref:Pre-processing protein 40C n=1 Tax=Sesamum angolense TaxID=2727404 RepID=A0AAE1W7B9_9LAMI|nr:Pre-processing protein 40C [Sesamum angolense]